MLILDASGSMWGQIDGRTKIEIVREVMEGMAEELPDELNIGLVTYGHRRKGDCSDVQEIRALGPLDKPDLIHQIKRLNPKGKTPLSRSVRETAQLLKHMEDETTILLVSDGKETCDADPCALVKELKDSGIKFVLHVVGFGVKGEAVDQLECMAHAGGGTYYTASTASEFKVAVKQIQQSGQLKVIALRNGKPIAADVSISLVQQEVETGSTALDRNTPLSFKLDKGQYQVEFSGIEIALGNTIEKVADFSDGFLKINTRVNGKWAGDTNYYIYKAGTKERVVESHVDHYVLVPGTYDVMVKHWKPRPEPEPIWFKGVEVKAGETKQLTAEFKLLAK